MRYFAVVDMHGGERIWQAVNKACIDTTSNLWRAIQSASCESAIPFHRECYAIDIETDFREAIFPVGLNPGDIREIDPQPLKLKENALAG